MRAWIIHETNRAPGDVLAEDKSYEVLHLENELGQAIGSQKVQAYNIARLDVLNLPSGMVLTLDGLPVHNMPDFVIARPVVLKDDPQWMPVLSFLERAKVLCINGVTPIEKTSDKYYMWQALAKSGMPTPPSLLLSDDIGIEQATKQFGYPFVLKQIVGTQGTGVALCKTEEDFQRAADMFRRRDPSIPLLAQEMITSSHGRDIRAFVVGDKVVKAMLRQSGSASEFRSNYHLGGSVTPFRLSEEGQHTAVGATQALGLKYSGVDLLFGETRSGQEFYVVCEVNHSPGFEGLEKAYSGLNAARLIVHHSIQCVYEHLANLSDMGASYGADLAL